MKPVKAAYKQVRTDSNEIFKGFGFKHLSDATQYYIHPDNISPNGTTTLCQSIGESVMLVTDLIYSMRDEASAYGDIKYSNENDYIYLEINVPDEWRDSKITNVYTYKAYMDITPSIKISAYDKDGNFIKSNLNDISAEYKLLPVLSVMLAKLILTNSDYRKLFMFFVNLPDAENFVTVHEDFYQFYKNDEYIIDYRDIKEVPKECEISFCESESIIRKNKAMSLNNCNVTINSFTDSTFKSEFSELIPELSEEFLISDELKPVCNAVVTGDIKSLLLHGPAGTGKTMSCKLICRETHMPVMATINCTEGLDEFVLGKFLPEGDKITFWESYVTKAIRFGGAVIFEEINFARPAHLAFLNSLLDDNGFVRLDNGEVIKRNENFRFFATMNIGYYGTKELNQALYNRFNAIVELSELSDDAIRRMLSSRVPECIPVLDKLVSVYRKLKRKIMSEELDMVISPRNIENWARLAKFEGYINSAEKTIIPIAKCDRSVEEAFRGIIMMYKWE